MQRSRFYLTLIIAAVFALALSLASCTGSSGPDTVKLYDGTEELYTREVTDGSTFSFPVPTKVGYTFVGWYSAPNGGAVYTDGTGSGLDRVWSSSCPAVLYAHWEANEYTLSFDYGDKELDDPVESVTVTYGDSLFDKIPTPAIEGYDFLGWFNESNNGKMIIDAEGNFIEGADVYTNACYKIGAGGTTLYARFAEKTVTFKFITEGSEVEELTVKMSDIIHSLPSSVRDGFCFAGWPPRLH